MGAKLSCPNGFEQGMMFSCHAKCPTEFKYIQELGGAGGPPAESCSHVTYPKRSFRLQGLRMTEIGSPEPPEFATERTRVQAEVAKIKALILQDEQTTKSLNEFNTQKGNYAQEYGKIQGDFAVFRTSKDASTKIKDVTDSLRSFRPPTAPTSDIEAERKKILTLSNKNLFFIQIALFLLLLSMVTYLILPADYAHGIVFLLLCTAISFGFFLR
jgi:hypothetical protein